MVDRDKQIIQTVERFRCLSRDQIAALFFSHCKKPATNANMTLKRLRDRKYLTVSPYRQPFIYTLNPSPIKKDSNKIDHFLALSDVYIRLLQHGNVKVFEVEKRYPDADVRPDIFTIFKGTPLYIEVQNTAYSNKVMQKKIDLYNEFYDSGKWKELWWQKQDRKYFPYLVLISGTKYDLDTGRIQVVQFRDVGEFIRSIL